MKKKRRSTSTDKEAPSVRRGLKNSNHPSLGRSPSIVESNAGLQLFFDIQFASEEIQDSNLSDGAKFLLDYILQSVLCGGEPLLGLLSSSQIKKGRTLYNKAQMALAFYLRKSAGLSSKVAADAVARLSGRGQLAKAENRSLDTGTSSVYAAAREFPLTTPLTVPANYFNLELRRNMEADRRANVKLSKKK